MEINQNLENLIPKLDGHQFIGLGNVNAKILFIGKESGIEIGAENFHGSPKSYLEKNFDYSKSYIPDEIRDKNVRNMNHTWQRYQKLYDLVIKSLNLHQDYVKKDKYEITFVENVFTTELSNLHAKTTGEAKQQENFQSELQKRKQVFFKSDFINEFPIVVIFANDNKYIETYPGEVCELFNVKFDYIHDYPGKDKIWVHSSSDSNKPKLLIHTRQLTNSLSIGLIDNLALLIADFIKQNDLIFESIKNRKY